LAAWTSECPAFDLADARFNLALRETLAAADARHSSVPASLSLESMDRAVIEHALKTLRSTRPEPATVVGLTRAQLNIRLSVMAHRMTRSMPLRFS